VDPVELPPGRYEVVLEPAAVADILQNLALFGFNGKAYAERRSFAVLGEDQFDPAITLVDDPLGRAIWACRSTAKVPPPARMSWSTPAEPRPSRSTGVPRRAPAAGPIDRLLRAARGSRVRAFATSLRVDTDGTAPVSEVDGPVADSAAAGLVAKVERALVTDFWYTRVLDPKQLAITGLTRNGVWLIENGEVIRPLTNFRFTQAYRRAGARRRSGRRRPADAAAERLGHGPVDRAGAAPRVLALHRRRVRLNRPGPPARRRVDGGRGARVVGHKRPPLPPLSRTRA
jgi:hypothetical protein